VTAVSPAAPPTTAVRATALPHTGSRSTDLLAIALTFAALGGMFLAFAARIRGRVTGH